MKSIKTLALATAIVAAPLMLTACGGDTTKNAAFNPQSHSITTTLSGDVYNAVTKQKINLRDIKGANVTLWQGDKKVKASFDKETGYYTLKDIPTSIDSNITYKVSVDAEGYQSFVGYVTINANVSKNQEGGTSSLYDKEIFKVGNINLFPVGFTAPDYKVCLTYTSKNVLVDTATVELEPATGNNFTVGQAAQTLTVVNFEEKPVMAASFANGCATFAGTGLTLGATYNVRVRNASFGGAPLAYQDATTASFNAGSSNQLVTIPMTDTTINVGAEYGLFVESFSNTNIDAIHSTEGKLTITFSKPVEAVNKSAVTVTGGNIGTLVNAQNVDVQVNGNVVTLAPNFLTGKSTSDITGTTKLTYDDLTVRLAGTNTAVKQITFDVFNPGSMQTSSGVSVASYQDVRFKAEF